MGSMKPPRAVPQGSLAPGLGPGQGLCQGLCRRRVSDEPWQQYLAQLHNERGSCHADMDWDLLLGEVSNLQRNTSTVGGNTNGGRTDRKYTVQPKS